MPSNRASRDRRKRPVIYLLLLCELIATRPQLGRRREELAPGLRSFPAGSYFIFYQPIADGIEVVRVLHASRDIDSLF